MVNALDYLKQTRELVEPALEAVLPPAGEAPESLHGAMRHLFFRDGKYFRPALALAAAEAAGGAREAALPAAVAVELVHTYSLVHDDLPCMDDDDERRGVASVHVAFGEATALLAGDALLTLAFESLSRAQADPRALLAVSRELSRYAGSRHLVGGQDDDLVFDRQPPSADSVRSIHLRKTAALIAASVVGGGILGGADADLVERLRRFALDVGVGFQIADDLLDDDREGECSQLRVESSAEARARAQGLLEQALAELATLGAAAEALRELARFAVARRF